MAVTGVPLSNMASWYAVPVQLVADLLVRAAGGSQFLHRVQDRLLAIGSTFETQEQLGHADAATTGEYTVIDLRQREAHLRKMESKVVQMPARKVAV